MMKNYNLYQHEKTTHALMPTSVSQTEEHSLHNAPANWTGYIGNGNLQHQRPDAVRDNVSAHTAPQLPLPDSSSVMASTIATQQSGCYAGVILSPKGHYIQTHVDTQDVPAGAKHGSRRIPLPNDRAAHEVTNAVMYPTETDVSHLPGYSSQIYPSGHSIQSASTTQSTMLPSNIVTNSTISRVPPNLSLGQSVADNHLLPSAPCIPVAMSNAYHLVHRSHTAPQRGTLRPSINVEYQRSQSDRPTPESREMYNVPNGRQQTAQRSGQYQNSRKGTGQPNYPVVFPYQTDKNVQPHLYSSSKSSWVSPKVCA